MPTPHRTPPEILTYRDVVRLQAQLDFKTRMPTFAARTGGEREHEMDPLNFRKVLGPTGREVRVRDHVGREQDMLMFGSNNYLGLGTHPKVVEAVRAAALEYGAGVGGPPILNGNGPLHRRLQERLAALEGHEAALIFGTGYAANLGLMSTLPTAKDMAVYDSDSHASFLDGLKLGRVLSKPFDHNDAQSLDRVLSEVRDQHRDVFVGVEGVYSMSGDVARLDRIADVTDRHGALLVVDDAHGTGVTGPNGHGTVAMFDAADRVTAVVGTFSKAFSVSGGFVTGSRDVVEYLRYFARPYVFSSSLSPAVCAAVLAGLDVLDEEPERHAALQDTSGYLADRLTAMGFEASGLTPIFPLPVAARTDIRAAAHDFHRRGLFVNQIEAPAVPLSEQRFRFSVTADHTRADVDRLLEAVEAVWAAHVLPHGDGATAGVPDEPALDAYQGGY